LPIAFEVAEVEPFFDAETYYDRYEEFTDDSDDLHGFRERCFATLAEERGRDPEEGKAVARAYADERDHTDVTVCSGASRTLTSLHDEYRMGVVTNGGPNVQGIKLSVTGFGNYFDTIVFAGYDTPAKPGPEPFEQAIDDLNAPPSRALHVGDSLELDVAGAKKAGLQTAWITSRNVNQTDIDPRPDFVFESLEGLREEPWK
jgi:putative hydrolase of the HAD superfamily